MCPCGDGRLSVEHLSCIFVVNIYAVYLYHIFWIRFLVKYIYKYQIHNNTWKLSGEYFMSKCHGAGADEQVGNIIACFLMHLEKYFYVDVSMLASMLCRHGDAPVGKMEKPLHLLLHTSLMC